MPKNIPAVCSPANGCSFLDCKIISVSIGNLVTGDAAYTQDYCDNFEYKDGELEAIYHGVGRLFLQPSLDRYQYTIRDHLGNTRILFAKSDTIGLSNNVTILQASDYYPFGMQMEGEDVREEDNHDYLFNGKELDTDFGLNWYHYGARMYDPAFGRFTGVDPISDQFAWVSTYNYAENEPIANVDLHGLQKHRMVDGSSITGPVSPEVLEDTNTEIVADQLIAQNESSEITDIGLAEVISTNSQQGEGMMEIFSPDNVGTVLLLSTPSKLPSSRAAPFARNLKNNMIREANRVRDNALKDLSKLSRRQRSKVSTVTGAVNKRTGESAAGLKRTGKDCGSCAEDGVV